MPRHKHSPRVWDRKEILRVLKTEGYQAACERYRGIVQTIVNPLARAHGIDGPRKYESMHWTPEMVAVLGAMPDAEAAAKLGMPMSTVSKERVLRGIQPVKKSKAVNMQKAAQIPDDELMVGSIDALKVKYALPLHVLTLERRRRGLKRVQDKRANVAFLMAAVAAAKIFGVTNALIAQRLHVSKQRVDQIWMDAKVELRALLVEEQDADEAHDTL